MATGLGLGVALPFALAFGVAFGVAFGPGVAFGVAFGLAFEPRVALGVAFVAFAAELAGSIPLAASALYRDIKSLGAGPKQGSRTVLMASASDS